MLHCVIINKSKCTSEPHYTHAELIGANNWAWWTGKGCQTTHYTPAYFIPTRAYCGSLPRTVVSVWKPLSKPLLYSVRTVSFNLTSHSPLTLHDMTHVYVSGLWCDTTIVTTKAMKAAKYPYHNHPYHHHHHIIISSIIISIVIPSPYSAMALVALPRTSSRCGACQWTNYERRDWYEKVSQAHCKAPVRMGELSLPLLWSKLCQVREGEFEGSRRSGRYPGTWLAGNDLDPVSHNKMAHNPSNSPSKGEIKFLCVSVYCQMCICASVCEWVVLEDSFTSLFTFNSFHIILWGLKTGGDFFRATECVACWVRHIFYLQETQ